MPTKKAELPGIRTSEHRVYIVDGLPRDKTPLPDQQQTLPIAYSVQKSLVRLPVKSLVVSEVLETSSQHFQVPI
jgi:hypothetical protein